MVFRFCAIFLENFVTEKKFLEFVFFDVFSYKKSVFRVLRCLFWVFSGTVRLIRTFCNKCPRAYFKNFAFLSLERAPTEVVLGLFYVLIPTTPCFLIAIE